MTRWPVQHGEKKTDSDPFEVAAGATVDLIVDCRKNVSFDSFNWSFEIANVDNPAERFSMASQFHGPLPDEMTGWEMLAQALLLSNEFQFVD